MRHTLRILTLAAAALALAGCIIAPAYPRYHPYHPYRYYYYP